MRRRHGRLEVTKGRERQRGKMRREQKLDVKRRGEKRLKKRNDEKQEKYTYSILLCNFILKEKDERESVSG